MGTRAEKMKEVTTENAHINTDNIKNIEDIKTILKYLKFSVATRHIKKEDMRLFKNTRYGT